MRGGTTFASALVVLGSLVGAVAIAPTAVAGVPTAVVPVADGSSDIVVIGDTDAASKQSSGYRPPGPVAGTPRVELDAASSTVTLSVVDPTHGGTASVTVAWPMHLGTWWTDFNGPDPEQTVRLTRGAQSCTYTGGSLTVHRAEATATGQVSALSADITGSCSIGGGHFSSAQIRIGDPEPTRAVAVPRATPARISTGALVGTVVTHDVTVTNSGPKPWKVGTAAIASANGFTPRFAVVPGANLCTGVTLATGQSCTVQVSATAPNYMIDENLLIGGDASTLLVVPVRLEGYNPVEPPTAARAETGRLSATIAWDAPSVLPRTEYRVYDTTNGIRTLLATAPPSTTTVEVPVGGPRTLSVVSANGTFAESPEVDVDLPVVASEVVGNDWYGHSQSVATDAAAPRARKLTVERVDLDPSRTRWVTDAYSNVSVCAVATGACTPVPGTAATGAADLLRGTAWLPDGGIAFLRGDSEEQRTLWVVHTDGSGLRKVASLPSRSQVAAVPSGDEVVLRSLAGVERLERVRLSDGRVTPIPNTDWADDFTVSTQGLLVVERRKSPADTLGPRIHTVMKLDGSEGRTLNLPAGDNREVVFDRTGTRVAYARYTDWYQATMWVAGADGSGARQLSDASAGWLDLKWSASDTFAPTASVNVPAYTTRTATLTIGASDRDDASGSLRRQCRLDSATTWTDCGASLTLTGLAAGTHKLTARASDPSGRISAEVSRSWVVDASTPTAALAAPAAVQTTPTTTLTWTASDSGGSGLSTYDVRTRVASRSGVLGGYQYPASWQKRTTRSLGVTPTGGSQYCFSVRAHDKAGNAGAWSPDRCTSMPLDDRSMSASTGWSRGTSSAYLHGTWTRATRTASQLTVASVRGRHLAIVATTCATCGSIDVYHAGVKLGRVSLYSSTTKTRQVKWLPLQSVTRYGTVTIRTTGTRQVIMDGLAIAH
ncbi:hypothetical protein [Pedococcus bigeumensis]|uniref:hypothetical protein n=1 Tax=Pedococcus bigeumensis TaxID=433644 RepID=UPI0031E083BC